ncbi:hypothetical protein [Spiroplasma floricola]|uniref:Transmembrane protein n=1 Tax=Spiroplasma floricola 23-6 TaxID=1336749 RepID=A0A2K8SDS1_9MOLU|nr:hypothetical protein [Spiroplasma floricola]AUB31607.1 hypothetical protein SFLOR_v1c05550 [Spiroplasma floricola 23-6]
MNIKLKEINSQRIKACIVTLILQTMSTLSLLIAAVVQSIYPLTNEAILLLWLFSIYFLYANIWIGIVLAMDLKNKINSKNEIKLLFSGVGSIISIFSLIVWIIFVREIYYEKKYNIDLLENVGVEDEETSSKGE